MVHIKKILWKNFSKPGSFTSEFLQTFRNGINLTYTIPETEKEEKLPKSSFEVIITLVANNDTVFEESLTDFNSEEI